jgi:hypothetical protein
MAVTPVFAQGGGHSGGAGSHKQALSGARDHINGNKDLSAEEARHLQRVELVEREMTAIDDATNRVLAIAAREGVSLTAAQKAEIEAEVREHLARIGSSHARLAALQKELLGEIEASDLTAQQKAEIKATAEKLAQGKISLQEARASLTTESGFVTVLMMFIALVVIGSGWTLGGG